MSDAGEEKEGRAAIALYTVGHSNRSAEEFTGLLRANGVEVLADVRRLPGSNKYPHFNRDELSELLAGAGVRYVYLEGLGGRRRPDKDSRNVAWRNKSFRAYADHMETAEFREGIAALLAHARQIRTASMCAEAVWWRCHRALWVGALGALVLVGYGVVPTFQPAIFGCVYAAYGGVFVAMSMLWGWWVDGQRPDAWDLFGACL
jgi:drug/metabolite transporter superfamily protein YnfA